MHSEDRASIARVRERLMAQVKKEKKVDAQEEYWQLSEKVNGARDALAVAEHAMRAFERTHDGESFLVFRPEDVFAAFSDDIKPLWPNRDVGDG